MMLFEKGSKDKNLGSMQEDAEEACDMFEVIDGALIIEELPRMLSDGLIYLPNDENHNGRITNASLRLNDTPSWLGTTTTTTTTTPSLSNNILEDHHLINSNNRGTVGIKDVILSLSSSSSSLHNDINMSRFVNIGGGESMHQRVFEMDKNGGGGAGGIMDHQGGPPNDNNDNNILPPGSFSAVGISPVTHPVSLRPPSHSLSSQTSDSLSHHGSDPNNHNHNDSNSVTGDHFTDFYIGLCLAVSSSLFIGASFILKKKALIRLTNRGEGGVGGGGGGGGNNRAGMGGHGYLKDWMWWTGVLTMGLGEAFNFIAYAFAPASLVTPLGALSVLVTTVLSSRLLKENLNLLGKIGCAICLLGSTIIVIHSPKEENVGSMEELGQKMVEPVWILYVCFVVASAVVLIFYIGPRHGSTNILVYIVICSLIGSLSVVGCKGLGLAITESLGGRSQLRNGFTWLWLFSVILCITIQLNYLNKALDLFNTSMVTPIYYVFFTSFVILASGILFKEWIHMTPENILGNLVGFTTIVIGIFQMQLFKEVNLTLNQLRHMIRKRSPTTTTQTGSINNNSAGDSASTSCLYHDGSNIREPLLGGGGGDESVVRGGLGGRRSDSWSDLPEGDRDRALYNSNNSGNDHSSFSNSGGSSSNHTAITYS